MKSIVLGSVVLVGLQTTVLGVCTSGRCTASTFWPSVAMAIAVATLATLMSRKD